jgi:putative flippase GtrA
MKLSLERMRQTKLGKLFLDRKFAHYTWIGIFISLLNIFLLWVLIDLMGIPTIIASSLVAILTFLLRYILFDRLKVF